MRQAGFARSPRQEFPYFMQVGHKGALLSIRLLPVAKAQQVGRMNGDEKTCAARRQKDVSALLRHTACPSRQRIKGRGPHRHDKVWIDKTQLRSQLPGAMLHFPAVWPGMYPTFPTLLEFEMFYGVGHVTLRTIYTGLQALVE